MTQRTLLFSRGSWLGIVLAALTVVLTTSVIHANTVASIAQEKTPLPVAVADFVLTDGYSRRASFVGVARAGSDSAVGFEVGGTIREMPARVGTRVAEGDVLAVLDTDRRQAQLRAAEAELTRIQAELELAQLQKQRLEDLQAKGLASQQAFDEARLGEAALAATLQAVTARRDNAALEISKSSLRAAFDGIVAERLAQEGAVVNAGIPILRLVASDGYEAHVGIPVALGGRLNPGDQLTLRSREREFTAPLRAIRRDVDPTTLTVGAVFSIPSEHSINAGENLLLELEERIDVVGGWLPITALLEGDRGLWNVLVVVPEGDDYITVRESVEVLYSREQRVFVRGTLANGAQVIATGLQRLSPGVRVTPLPAESR